MEEKRCGNIFQDTRKNNSLREKNTAGFVGLVKNSREIEQKTIQVATKPLERHGLLRRKAR